MEAKRCLRPGRADSSNTHPPTSCPEQFRSRGSVGSAGFSDRLLGNYLGNCFWTRMALKGLESTSRGFDVATAVSLVSRCFGRFCVLGDAGFEPATSCVSSSESSDVTTCDTNAGGAAEQACCTTGCTESQNAPLAEDLRGVVEAWPNLSDHTKATILKLIKSAGVPNDASE